MKSFIDANPFSPYLIAFAISLLSSLVLTPVFRKIALKLNILDCPHSSIKTHRTPTPYLGGLAIWSGWAITLGLMRFFTHFPTGTLRSLRGILVGSFIILILGLIDDIMPKGIGFKKKFLFQILAAACLLLFDIRLHFVSPYFVAAFFSILWAVGISNAFNIVDVMDGLSSGLAVICSLAFLFISLPTEQIYVNFCAVALAGGCLGFIPYNLSAKNKIFMGDTGSLTIGFILAAVSMGTSYSALNVIGMMAPLLILSMPLYDTFLVMFIRWKKGISPFMGSKDHFALRLEAMGYSRKQIIVIAYAASTILSVGAYMVTRLPLTWAAALFAVFVILAIYTGYWIGQVKVE